MFIFKTSLKPFTYVMDGLSYFAHICRSRSRIFNKKIVLGVGLKGKVLKKNAESKISYYNAKIRIVSWYMISESGPAISSEKTYGYF